MSDNILPLVAILRLRQWELDVEAWAVKSPLIGAFVELNSGSPPLLVTAIDDEGVATVEWELPDNTGPQSATFPMVCLRPCNNIYPLTS